MCIRDRGSGKSSLLKMLYADYPFNGEKGIVLGYDLANIKSKQIQALRRKIGIVFQDFQLLIDRNIEKNLEFVLRATGWKNKNEINNRIDEVLEMVGLRDVRKKMPHQISGGEQQKLVIARALLNNPELILADEPTGNLDLASSKDILEILINLKNNNRAIIMATHDLLSIQSFPQKTYKCEDGTFTHLPFTKTLPVNISSSASLLEQYPQLAINLFNLISVVESSDFIFL